jgi:RNA polymerase sigma-70 factor (ECF subfamily)
VKAERGTSPYELMDEELVEMAQNGDRNAFTLLVKRYQDRIYNLIYRYIGNAEDAIDLTQETFIKAFVKLGEFKGNSKFYTWLYRIAVNACIDFRRRQRISIVHWDDMRPNEFDRLDIDEPANSIDVVGEDSNPEAHMLKSELRQIVREAINTLPEHLRIVLILREYEDLSYEEIASIIGCRVGTVKSRLFQAREMLKRKLSPYISI